MKHIFIYGPPGSGKTTVGKILAQKIGYGFIDLDENIRSSAGIGIPQLMKQHGEAAFREIESNELKKVCQPTSQKRSVVSLGGGALLREANRDDCERSGTIVFLDAKKETLLSRIGKKDPTRPLLDGDVSTNLGQLLEDRKEHYASFPFRIAAKLGKSASMIAKEIQNELGLYTLRSMGRPYDVQIRSGAISQLSSYLDDIGVGLGDSLVVVFDTNTQLHYGKLIQEHLEQDNRPVKIVVLPHGEENKTLESIKLLWEAFIQAGMDRKSVVLAVGGGVTSDLVGFAASTYMRGCRWVCLPTTLLSMVDASIGGKTGFDLPQGKNLIGSFYPPELVLIDPEMLKTLPKDEFISGMAEVVKHGIIADPALFEDCSLGLDHINANLTDIVKKAVRVKVDVIEEDPYEKGKRASLNLGHTIGHAVEIESEFKLKHGEAIAIGIVAESRLAEKMGLAELGLTEKIIAVFETLKLPTSLPMEMNRERIIGFMKNDKKKSGNAVHFALPIKIGTVRTGIAIGNLEETL